MLAKALFLFVLVVTANCQFFSRDFLNRWNFRPPSELFPDLRGSASEIEEVTQHDREPLGPDYRDPVAKPSNEKPVIQLKPTSSSSTTTTPKPASATFPGGIIDVDANGGFSGFPSGGGFAGSAFPEMSPDFGLGLRPGGLLGFGGLFGTGGQMKPWWKGPNVCIEREEKTDDEDDAAESKKNETENIPNLFSTAVSLSNCHQTANKYECITKVNNHGVVKTFTVRYKCCYGYKRTPEKPDGCTKQADLKPLLQTIEDVGCREFRNMIKNNALDNMLQDGNYTTFVPTDNALNDFTERMVDLNKVEVVRRRRREIKNTVSSKNLILNHVIPGFVDLTELSNEQIINSENSNSSIRINVYPTNRSERMVTANCARVTKPDNLATNGIVHVVDGVVTPAAQSIRELLEDSKRLTNLKTVLKNTDLISVFKDDGHYTLFAPTDNAFNKLDESTKQKLLKGDACASSIFKYHIVEHTVCSKAIIGNATTHNIEGELLNLERTIDDELKLENIAKITDTDIMATNGVIHLVDTIIIPNSAQHVNQALKSQNFSKFEELIQQAGLSDMMDSLENATVFAPSDQAFEKPETKKLLVEINGDKERLKEIILYHTVNGQMQSADMTNNNILKSGFNGTPLRLNLYSTLPVFSNIINRATINCAKITDFDEKACGSVIHEINRLLVPPKKSILDIINSNDKFTTLRNLLKDTEVEKVLQESNQSISLLAPTDEAFAGLSEEDMKTLQEDKKKANEVLKNHVLTEVLCCAGVGPQTWGFNTLVPTLSGQNHQINRTGKHQIRIGRATVTSCDNLATNGVIHTINQVLIPQRHQAPSFGLFLFDI